MAKVSVEKKAVIGAISLCEYSVDCFQTASKHLKQNYMDAGATWKDSKYVQLGHIVDQCEQALRTPIKELEECVEQLQQMYRIMEEYEQLDW